MKTVTRVRAEIRRLYHETTPATVERDLARAISLLKELEGEAEREQVAVFMDGLSQMRSEWILAKRRAARTTGAPPASPRRRSGKPRTKPKRP